MLEFFAFPHHYYNFLKLTIFIAMKKIIVIAVLIIFGCDLYAGNPKSAYSLPFPPFKYLLPIPEIPKNLIVQNKLWSVTVSVKERYNYTKTTFHFNWKGLVHKSEKISDLKEDSLSLTTTHYLYNDNDKLVTRRIVNRDFEGYISEQIDSLGYNAHGQILFHKIYNNQRTDKLELFEQFRVKANNQMERIISKKENTGYNYYLNDSDEITKVLCGKRLDSVYISSTNSESYKKIYYHKNHKPNDDSLYIKQIDTYENNKLMFQEINGMLGTSHPVFYNYKYIYDNNMLLRKEEVNDWNSQYFYKYNKLGLMTLNVSVKGDETITTKYEYSFVEQ